MIVIVDEEAIEARRRRQREQKRRRYRDDEDYRERVKARARARYAPKSGVAKKRPRGWNKPRAIPINGRLVRCLSLGHAASILGVARSALRRYDQRRVIPPNRLVDSRGRRWYPEAFVMAIAPIFREQRRLREPLWRLRERVERVWRAARDEGSIPVVGDAASQEAE